VAPFLLDHPVVQALEARGPQPFPPIAFKFMVSKLVSSTLSQNYSVLTVVKVRHYGSMDQKLYDDLTMREGRDHLYNILHF